MCSLVVVGGILIEVVSDSNKSVVGRAVGKVYVGSPEKISN